MKSGQPGQRDEVHETSCLQWEAKHKSKSKAKDVQLTVTQGPKQDRVGRAAGLQIPLEASV